MCTAARIGGGRVKSVLADWKLRIVLPFAQMALAALLLRLSFLYDVAHQYDDSPGLHSGFILLLFVNFPVSVPLKFLLFRRLPPLGFDTIFVAAVGALWYGIASWMLIYRKRRAIFPPHRAWLRVSADLLLVAMGIFIAWAAVVVVVEEPHMLSPSHLGGWLWFAPVCVSLLFWSAGSILVFGYDFLNWIRELYNESAGKTESL